MSTTEQLHGHWWMPEGPSRKVSGTLVLSDAARPRLDLHDALIDFDSVDSQTVFGESGGRAISVFDAYVTSGSHSFRNGQEYREQTLNVSGLVVGNAHVSSTGAPAFIESVIELDYLTYWARGVELEVARPDPAGTCTFTVSIGSPRSARFGDVDVRISTSHRYTSRGSFSLGEMSIPAHFRTVFGVISAGPISIDGHLEVSRRLADLVTLAMHRPARIRRIKFFTSPVESELWEKFEWWGSEPATEDLELDDRSKQRVNFTLDDIDLETLLACWHKLHQTANYGMLSLVALQRESSTYYETKLLGVCGALEALHKGMHPAKLDYRERCLALAEIPPAEAVRQIIHDKGLWARNITAARNHLAHGDEPHRRKVPEDAWYRLYDTSMALLVLVAMTELGISEPTQMRTLSRGALEHAATVATG
ncbi:hypothetical protein IM877_15990 [Rhodococcus sp. GG48]|nr:hypothetical protein [Rhodococcus sp. GG48]